MIQAFYTGAVGAQQQMQHQNVRGNNIANINTYGYRAQVPAFQSLMYGMMDGAGDQLPRGTGTLMTLTGTDVSVGAPEQTGRELDYTITGNGFFALYDPTTGELTYSRDGSFTKAAFLEPLEFEVPAVLQGLTAQEEAQPEGIVLPEDTVVEAGTLVPYGAILPDGTTLPENTILNENTTLPAGTILLEQPQPTERYYLTDGEGRLVLGTDGCPIEVMDSSAELPVGVFAIQYQDGLERVGSNRFAANDKNGAVVRTDTKLMRGYLESSNADLATEMVGVIEAQRAYSYALKMVTTADEVETTVNNLANV